MAARQSCMDMHPGYEFRLWTDDSAREVLAKEMPQLLPTYDSYIYSIERADAIRCAPALPCKFLREFRVSISLYILQVILAPESKPGLSLFFVNS